MSWDSFYVWIFIFLMCLYCVNARIFKIRCKYQNNQESRIKAHFPHDVMPTHDIKIQPVRLKMLIIFLVNCIFKVSSFLSHWNVKLFCTLKVRCIFFNIALYSAPDNIAEENKKTNADCGVNFNFFCSFLCLFLLLSWRHETQSSVNSGHRHYELLELFYIPLS